MAILEVLKGVVSQHLLYAAGLWALLALVPLILVYLIRPRPKKQTIPALMFLMKESAKSDKTSFLRRFIKDPLFLFQILCLLAFAIAIAKPYMITADDVFVEKTALVIDASASSQVEIDGTSRIDRIIDTAKENVGSKNAIILISSVPELYGDDLDSSKARNMLDDIEPMDTPTNIFDAIIFASNYVNEKDRILVISDFIDSSTQKDFNAARSIVKSKGILVDFINVRDIEPRKANNIGIIDIDTSERMTSVQIKNFNDVNDTVHLSLEGADLTVDEIAVESKGVEVVSFPTPPALSRFFIGTNAGNDDFDLDNSVYISAPDNTPAPLLLISNDVSRYLKTALEVIDSITVETGAPPKVPDIAHQIIMMSNMKGDLILPGTMKKIKKQVEDGAMLIVVAQPDMLATDYLGLLPVERAENSGPVLMTEDRTVVTNQESTLTEDIFFGRIHKYLKVKPKDGSTVIASTENNVSMIVIKTFGKGSVVYFGMMDDYSDFKLDIYYPVFWKRLFDMALKKQDLSQLNFRTGRLINLLEKQKVKAPKGTVNTDTIMLDHQGIYQGESRSFVANLINEEESNINGEAVGEKKGIFEIESKGEEEVPFELTKYFVIGLLVLVFLELLWIKFRGDL